MDALSSRLLVHLLGPEAALPPGTVAALESAGIRLVFAPSRAALAKLAAALPPDAVLVRGVPRAAAVETLRRQQGRRGLPVLAVLDSAEQAVAALESGADDAFEASLAPALLAARLEAAVRRRERLPSLPTRGRAATADQALVLDLRGRRCLLREGGSYREALLTRRQFETLAALVRAQDKPVAWTELYAKGWRPGRLRRRSRTLVQHVLALRRKLGGHGERIVAVPGVGYRLCSTVRASS